MKSSLAYLAGLFDGEGSIAIARSLPQSNTGAVSPRYQLQVALTNGHAGVLQACSTQFGGQVSWNESKFPGATRGGRWQANARVAARFLQTVLPHLLMKKKQAELGIAFDEQFAGRHSKQLSVEQITERERWRAEVLSYHKKYLPVSKPWICVDLDGTLMLDGFYPEYGPPMPGAGEAMRGFHEQGIGIMVFTARMATSGLDGSYQNTNKISQDITRWAKKYDIWIDFVYPVPKPTFTLAFFDDRAIRFTPGKTGWAQAVAQFTAHYGSQLGRWETALLPPPLTFEE